MLSIKKMGRGSISLASTEKKASSKNRKSRLFKVMIHPYLPNERSDELLAVEG